MDYCCKEMERFSVDGDIKKSFEADDIIVFSEKHNLYGIIIHDGGSSFIKISRCPWCGKVLRHSDG